LQIWPPVEPLRRTAGRAEADGSCANSSLHRQVRQPDVLANHFRDTLAVDQPRGAGEPVLQVFRPRRPDVDVIVGVIADRVAFADDLLQPIDVFLFQRTPQDEQLGHAARGLDAAAGFHDVLFDRFRQIALFIVPFRQAPLGIVHGHLQVHRHRDQRRLVRSSRGPRGRQRLALPELPCRTECHVSSSRRSGRKYPPPREVQTVLVHPNLASCEATVIATLALAGRLGQKNEIRFPTFSCPNFPASLFLPTPYSSFPRAIAFQVREQIAKLLRCELLQRIFRHLRNLGRDHFFDRVGGDGHGLRL